MITQQGDVKLFQTNDGGEIVIENGIIQMSGCFFTAAYLSLFGGNEDDDGSLKNANNWWGNLDENDPSKMYRSETQNLLQALPITTTNLRRIEDACNRDLAWLIDEKIASSITVEVTMPALNTIDIYVSIIANGEESNFKFTENWKACLDESNQVVVSGVGVVSVDVPPLPLVPTYYDTIIAGNPLVYYRLGEVIGSVIAVDEMAIQDGVYVNTAVLESPSLLIGDSNTAVDFPGVDQRVDLSSIFELSFISTPFSFEAIINVNSLSTIVPIISKSISGTDANNEYLFQVRNNGSLEIFLYQQVTGVNHGWTTAAGLIVPGTKYHVVGTYGGTINSGKLYINGAPITVNYTTTGGFTSMSNTIGIARIGSRFINGALQAYFNGVIDEVSIWGAELTPGQVLLHYNASIGLPPPLIPSYFETKVSLDPISWWRLGESVGVDAVDVIALQNGQYSGASLGVVGLISLDTDTAVNLDSVIPGHVLVPYQPPFNFTDGLTDKPFTIEVVIKLNDLSVNRPIISKTGIPSVIANEWLFQIQSNGSLICVLYGGNTSTNHNWISVSSGLIVPGTKYHLVASYDGTINSGKLYINGAPITVNHSTTGYSNMSLTNSNVNIGAKFVGDLLQGYFDGVIDEPSLYDKVLSPLEILSLYNASIGSPSP